MSKKTNMVGGYNKKMEKSKIKGRCSKGDRDRKRDVDEARRWRRRREELSWPLAVRRVEPTLTCVPQG